mgnify:CR=1 FL=1
MRIWIAVASVLLLLGVGLGAFGAHGLRDRLDEYHLGVYEKGVFYHLIHALGLLGVAMFATQQVDPPRLLATTCVLLTVGIVLFSGSLYLLAITGTRWLGAITPFGGLSFLAAWATLAYAALRR